MPTTRCYQFETFTLDTRTRELRRGDGLPLPLSAKAFDTLCFLVENRERVVSKDELLASVWAGRVVEENNLTQAVSALRKAMGSGAGDHRYVVTIPGRGYRFVAEVRGDETVAMVDAPTIAHARPGRVWAATVGIGVALLLLVVLVVAAWPLSRFASTAPEPAARALAVLPFRALSSGSEDPLLELGLAETLVTRLSRSPRIRVRSISSSQGFGGEGRDAIDAGRQLGADYVVEGSVQRVGDSVRVNARLLSVESGSTLWANTLDSRIERVFTLQDAITDAITSSLALQPIVLPARARSPCNGSDPQAYRAYLRGYYLLQRPNPISLTDALSAFRHTLDLDSACTRAYAGMALAYRGLVHTDREPARMFPLAKAAVARALEIDPDSAEALMARGRNQHLYDWDWVGAEASFKRAIELNPSLAEAHFGYAHLLVDLGRFDEGLAHAQQARELDPLSPHINALEAGFLTAARRPDAARRRVDQALELRPGFWIALLVRGGMALDQGDTTAAISDFRIAAERSQRTSQILAVLAVAHAAAGNGSAARAILAELEGRAASGYVPATSLAAVHNALGDTERALDLLERAYDERDIRLAFVKVDARWNNLRTQPRFKSLAQRMGLAGGPGYGRY